jgi:hypothetical protein
LKGVQKIQAARSTQIGKATQAADNASPRDRNALVNDTLRILHPESLRNA